MIRSNKWLGCSDVRTAFSQASVACRALLAIAFGLSWAGAASAGYVGESFLQVPDVPGGWSGEKYKDWVKFEAREWTETPTCAARQKNPNALVCDERFFMPGESHLFFSSPLAPPSGSGKLAVALDKRSPALKGLMDLCRRKATISEVTYAESAERSRLIGEVGPRPTDVPEYFEYKLKDVQLSCPVIAAAPEQAFVLSFNDIAWLNFRGDSKIRKLVASAVPARLPPRPTTGESRTFLISSVMSSAGYDSKECPRLTKEPTEADYFSLVSKSVAAKEKVELERRGGLPALGPGIAFRGPDRLSVCALPGIVADPGNVGPESDVAEGFDLDGYDGKGEFPPSVHRHKNYVSADGRPGIDNQLYTVEACVPGFRPDGNIPKITNEMMRNGALSILLEISGIDDAQNDDSVVVTVLYGKDRMLKTADGKQVLPNYTFRISDDPEWTQYFTRLQGHIENGVVITDPIDEMTFQDGGQRAFKLFDTHMRIELLPNNKIRAVVGGYHDWRVRLTNWLRARLLEPTMRFQCPGLYNAFKRAADGLRDPVTGEFNGISVAYELEGVRAFTPPGQVEAMSARSQGTAQKTP
jgi:hypothetical protein